MCATAFLCRSEVNQEIASLFPPGVGDQTQIIKHVEQVLGLI